VSSFHRNASKRSGYDCYHAGYLGMVKHWYWAMDVWIDQEFSLRQCQQRALDDDDNNRCSNKD
jgi:hypothetical protein